MPKCACNSCNAIGKYKLPARKRGGGNAYLCEYHWSHDDAYSADNLLWIGPEKAHGYTASFENETKRPTRKARIELCINGFRPTSDSTVDTEFKSPCYNGFNALKAILPSIEDLKNDRDITIDSDCGTHLHIGNRYHINIINMEAIRRFYHSLYLPLSQAMEANPEKTARIFGRGFGYWARAINQNTEATEHTNFINTQHPDTIEFRLCKFVTAAQYSEAVDFCREIARITVEIFLKKYENIGRPSRANTTEQQREELKKAAQKAARKMVKTFNEWTI